MNYNLKGTDVSITDELRTYIEKKLSALDKHSRRDSARVDIVVAYTANGAQQYKAEMTLHDAGEPLHAECSGSTLHEAIDAVASEFEAELSKFKKKRQSNFRHSAVRVKEFLRGWRNKI